jgi:chemotaxis protein methyltransferase CheR
VFRLLRDQIYRRSGIWFNDSSKYLLQKRLSPRARELNFDSFQKYFYFLQYDPRADAEFDQIFDLVTTNETYFFREPAQLQAFVEEIVPDLMARKSVKKIRIWSAGCSSGEEAYSIAMLLEETGWYDHAQFEIFASDINQQVLAKARKGFLSRERLPRHRAARCARSTSPARPTARGASATRSATASPSAASTSTTSPRLAPRAPRHRLLPQRDHLLRRRSKKVVVSNFYNRLVDGGYLLLGHSESLISLSTQFKLRHLKNDMVYQK